MGGYSWRKFGLMRVPVEVWMPLRFSCSQRDVSSGRSNLSLSTTSSCLLVNTYRARAQFSYGLFALSPNSLFWEKLLWVLLN